MKRCNAMKRMLLAAFLASSTTPLLSSLGLEGGGLAPRVVSRRACQAVRGVKWPTRGCLAMSLRRRKPLAETELNARNPSEMARLPRVPAGRYRRPPSATVLKRARPRQSRGRHRGAGCQPAWGRQVGNLPHRFDRGSLMAATAASGAAIFLHVAQRARGASHRATGCPFSERQGGRAPFGTERVPVPLVALRCGVKG
jgi:hypothetical protein